MGKKDQWKGKDNWKSKSWEESPPWLGSLWRGARPAKEQGQKPWRPQGPKFPAYDADWTQTQEMIEVSSSSTTGRPDSLVKNVQDVVNAVRKADNRVNKLRADQHAKAQCWNTYVQKMQAAFVAERKKHLASVEKMNQELEEAQAQQHSTREMLSQAALGVTKPTPKRDTAADAEWTQLMSQAQNEAEDPMEVDVVALGKQISELLQPPAVARPCPTFGPDSADTRSQGGLKTPVASMKDAFNHLAPGLGDAIAETNAKREGDAGNGGFAARVNVGTAVESPAAGPARAYSAVSPRAHATHTGPLQVVAWPGQGSRN